MKATSSSTPSSSKCARSSTCPPPPDARSPGHGDRVSGTVRRPAKDTKSEGGSFADLLAGLDELDGLAEKKAPPEPSPHRGGERTEELQSESTTKPKMRARAEKKDQEDRTREPIEAVEQISVSQLQAELGRVRTPPPAATPQAPPPSAAPSLAQLQDIAQQMLKRCQVIRNGNATSIDMQLETSRMSKVGVKLQLSAAGRVSAQMATEDEGAYRSMIGAVEQLQQRFEDRGIGADVEVTLRKDHSQQQQQRRKDESEKAVDLVERGGGPSARAVREGPQPAAGRGRSTSYLA